MKKTVRVVIEKEIEIDIPEILLTPQHIKDFNSYIGLNNDVEDVEDCRNELFEFVARMAAQGYDEAEGMGQLGSKYMKEYARQPEYYIIVDTTCDDIETEIVE
jgi:hypothetical protein